MQLPAIRAARRLGLQVIVADGNDQAPGRDEADEFLHVDLRDRTGMLEAARSVRASGRLDAVFTAGTDFSSTVAYVAEALDLPGIPYETAMNATDKSRMRSVLSKAGVRVPTFAVLSVGDLSSEGVGRAIDVVGLPCVVKPADSMGARGVVRADTVADALGYAGVAVEHSATQRVVIEGFIPGPEFSLDALVFHGVIQQTGFADRHIEFPPFFIEMGHTIPSDVNPDDRARIIHEFEKGIRALGIENGAAKGAMKLSPDGPVVGEIAARLAGGYMSGWTYPLSTGVELTEQAIRISLGEPPGRLNPAWNRTSAERAVISIPGVVERFDHVPATGDSTGLASVFLTRHAGDAVKMPTSNVEKCGNVIAVSESREVAVASAERAVAALEVVLQPGVPETTEFLLGRSDGHWAFDRGPLEGGMWAADAPMKPVEQSWRGPISVGSVPRSTRADWQWRSLSETVARLEREGLVTTSGDNPHGALVRRAILRGGIQGGRYILRTCFGAPA